MGKACLMLPLDFEGQEFFNFITSLDKSLISEENNGIEWFNHTTVLYGIDNPGESILPLAKLINSMHMFPVKLGKISFFRNNKDFDVMKVDIDSKALEVLNHLVKNTVPYTNSFPEYIPHFTLAYVKKGAFEELEGCDFFKDMEFKSENVVFSFPDHSCLEIPFYNSNKLKS